MLDGNRWGSEIPVPNHANMMGGGIPVNEIEEDFGFYDPAMITSLASGAGGHYTYAQGSDARNGVTGESARAAQANTPASKDASPNASQARSASAVQPAPANAPAPDGTSGKSRSGEELSEQEKKQVNELKARDREVRAHEQAHARVGGPYAGAPSYEFQQGPDGKRYAVGGEVSIDSSAESTPEETVRKMEVVIRAALAPAEPSSQDRRVAAEARQQLIEAQAQSRKEKSGELNGEEESGPPGALDLAKEATRRVEEAKAEEGDPSVRNPLADRLNEAINAYGQLAGQYAQGPANVDASALFNLTA